MQTYISMVGFLAAALTTGCFLPQIYRCAKTKHTKDISWGYFITLGMGITLWAIYGITVHDVPLILANTISFVFVLIILGMKLKYG